MGTVNTVEIYTLCRLWRYIVAIYWIHISRNIIIILWVSCLALFYIYRSKSFHVIIQLGV